MGTLDRVVTTGGSALDEAWRERTEPVEAASLN